MTDMFSSSYTRNNNYAEACSNNWAGRVNTEEFNMIHKTLTKPREAITVLFQPLSRLFRQKNVRPLRLM